MRIVVALGGNALLQRGQPMTAEQQRANVRTAAAQLAPIGTLVQLVGVVAGTHGTQVEPDPGSAPAGGSEGHT